MATVPCGSVYICPEGTRWREKPPLPPRYYGPYKMCRHHRSCRFGILCKFAHSAEECIDWNGKLVMMFIALFFHYFHALFNIMLLRMEVVIWQPLIWLGGEDCVCVAG